MQTKRSLTIVKQRLNVIYIFPSLHMGVFGVIVANGVNSRVATATWTLRGYRVSTKKTGLSVNPVFLHLRVPQDLFYTTSVYWNLFKNRNFGYWHYCFIFIISMPFKGVFLTTNNVLQLFPSKRKTIFSSDNHTFRRVLLTIFNVPLWYNVVAVRYTVSL